MEPISRGEREQLERERDEARRWAEATRDRFQLALSSIIHNCYDRAIVFSWEVTKDAKDDSLPE